MTFYILLCSKPKLKGIIVCGMSREHILCTHVNQFSMPGVPTYTISTRMNQLLSIHSGCRSSVYPCLAWSGLQYHWDVSMNTNKDSPGSNSTHPSFLLPGCN